MGGGANIFNSIFLCQHLRLKTRAIFLASGPLRSGYISNQFLKFLGDDFGAFYTFFEKFLCGMIS